jgi:hypothetical protein
MCITNLLRGSKEQQQQNQKSVKKYFCKYNQKRDWGMGKTKNHAVVMHELVLTTDYILAI